MTKSFKWVIVFLIFLLTSCASQRIVEIKPSPKLHEMVLAKSIDDSGDFGVPQNPTSEFTTEDNEIVSFLALDNISGKHELRWEWLMPDGNVYLATDDYLLEVEKHRYLPKTTAWHQLSIKDEAAAAILGQWKVNLYVDDELKESKQFHLKDPIDLPDNLSSKTDTKNWGLIIGIEDYNAPMPDAQFAREDALTIRDYFIRILGIPKDHLITLMDRDATKARIEGFLKGYLPKNVAPDSTLYVYFAGHGIPGSDKNWAPYLVPYDADRRIFEETSYKLKSFYQDINDIKLKRAYVFLDACFSGMASRSAKTLITDKPIFIEVEKVSPPNTIIALSSSGADQVSQAYPQKKRGLFTFYLLLGLRGEADTDKDAWVSVKELYDYVLDNVQRESRRLTSAEQTPVLLPPIEDGRKDALLARIAK